MRTSADQRPPSAARTRDGLHHLLQKRMLRVRSCLVLSSQCLRADTSVVSMASWATPNNGSPSDTVVGQEVHLTDHDVCPDSCPCFPADPQPRSPTETLSSPESLPRNRLRGGGQGSQKDGHTGSGELTGEATKKECAELLGGN